MEENQPEGEWKVAHGQYEYAYILSKLQSVYVGHRGLNFMPQNDINTHNLQSEHM